MALDPTARLHKQERRPVPFSIPRIVSQRLDDLCALINDEGNLIGRVYRNDLVAALIALAPETATGLEQLLDDYTNLHVRDAQVGGTKDAEVIELRPIKPGRRPA